MPAGEQQIADSTLAGAPGQLGDPAGGQVQVKAPAGHYRITARLARPWAPDQPVKTVEIDLVMR
ncbi:hypothetical protein [Sandarakinorhabdus limnophila]|uniref:hypothetical protein n=1 Tax=Sandarakinorhabdus limnophila TaxID=210512 RepID=UPI0026EEFA84|nr:hypothetical protein [Sandarakinorhabdus limnophila]